VSKLATIEKFEFLETHSPLTTHHSLTFNKY
jgi:hypothetical protein